MLTSSLLRAGWFRCLMVLLVCGFSFFPYLGTPNVSLMEARNFVAAREMAQGGSWLIPTMNLELRLAKPPLPTWAVATAMKLFGTTSDLFVLRLPAALMATLLVLFFWGLARELTRRLPTDTDQPGRTAWLAALVLASSLLIITSGREGQWDIFSNGFMVGTLWLLTRGWNSAGRGYGWFAGAGVALGACILSKGPVAPYAMLLPYVGCYVSGLNPWRATVRAHWQGTLLAAVLGLAIGLSWPLYVFSHVPTAVLAVARVETTSWGERHVQPFWYYLNFPVFSGIWTLVALAALWLPYARRRAGAYVPYLLLFGWLMASLVLLSLVPEKKERYMLPLLPPMALLIAGMLRYLETVFRTASTTVSAERGLVRGWAVVLVVVCLLAPLAMVLAQLPGFGPATLRFAVVVVVLGGLAVIVFREGWQRVRPVSLMAASLTGMAALLALLLPAYPLWEGRRDEQGLRHLVDVRRQPTLRNLPWYSMGEVPVKQVWMSGEPMPDISDDTLRTPARLPVVVLSEHPYEDEDLPDAWQDSVDAMPSDSFYLGRDRGAGTWYYTVLQPK
ncbi:glycosyltransferase family 39 protein [Hymenobacter aerilatus]|uniref:Glycosyltransferase family 39 protein n=1 Tax=Hymenobacter aerilatus TaxID=2932251 RepID=A0A8T9T1P0_9BACT|nr:glycosyltransferase family 39 protein [Hymenobacter aerilatus]UOR06893.1 glycosyltransferase family 39 protein [Hymenobacter aerilatus]